MSKSLAAAIRVGLANDLPPRTPPHPLVSAHLRVRGRTGVSGEAARINADGGLRISEGEKHMMYFERNQPHYLVWPALGLGRDDLHGFWIGIGWFNMEIGWKEKAVSK